MKKLIFTALGGGGEGVISCEFFYKSLNNFFRATSKIHKKYYTQIDHATIKK